MPTENQAIDPKFDLSTSAGGRGYIAHLFKAVLKRHDYTTYINERLADASVDMVLADLPYGTTQCAWDVVIPFEPLWREYLRIADAHDHYPCRRQSDTDRNHLIPSFCRHARHKPSTPYQGRGNQ
ncbi:hypothetical protein [Pseudomonas sp. GM48]|uniref:hypothetical protein n=1 Tax=Pseudomonas sp. GM48 TaxID=1144330 RepID=UPI00026FFFFE|nr:hypothetical protein [Pseudomonas sp. GM48]EJM48115.1 hypothetical protein PMI28_05691 [Pseudomonas sp. GM48]